MKGILIKMVMGGGFRSMTDASELTSRGLAKFCGNQWNENWCWDEEGLNKLSIPELYKLFRRK